MTPDTAIRYAQSLPTQPAESRPEGLTKREMEVVGLVSLGLSNRQIAERLVITERTAAAHVHSILEKLDLASRAQVVAWAAEHGLLAQRS
jgi:DNA-binding NarL/FixJ family response regulator